MTTVPYSPTTTTKTFSIKQESFFDECRHWLFDGVVDWDLVPQEVMDAGIDLYFGPEADTDFFFEAIENLDGTEYAQAIVNMVRNDRDTLAAAGSFQTMIQKKLRDWMTDHVDSHVSYDPDVESLGNY
jgi:hypothetical protein